MGLETRFHQKNTKYHPLLICYQMITFQLLFYSGLIMFSLFFDFLFQTKFCLDQLFSFTLFEQAGDLDSYTQIGFLSLLFSIPVAILGLVEIVVKGNKVLDFMITLEVLHIMICSLYGGTLNVNWVLVNGLWCLITTLSGEYICIRFEQQEVRFLEKLFKTPHHKYKKTDEIKIHVQN